MQHTTNATARIIEHFHMVCEIPRPSRSEQRIRARLVQWAAAHQLQSRTDQAGNLVIEVPASRGCRSDTTVVLQGHMDMVCEKLPGSRHNFETDPIATVVDGEWLAADGTTLGADNGIAIALALAVAQEQHKPHPALELLFTVEEETGLSGAARLDGALLRGSALINLDSEDEAVITVGCAGGTRMVLTLPLERTAVPAGLCAYRVTVSGLSGGHSGTDIGLGRANANVLLTRLLLPLDKAHSVRLASLSGGHADNAIARHATADIVMAEREFSACSERLAQLQHDIRCEYQRQDPDLSIECVPLDSLPREVFPPAETSRVLQLLNALPHGVAVMSPSAAGLVQTSSNLAAVASNQRGIEIVCTLRGSVASELDALAARHASLAALAGAEVRTDAAYPGWEPDFQSELLTRARVAGRACFQSEPRVEVVHAGLECGVIGARYPQMQMISIGPTIANPHSPNERLHLRSLERTWEFLTEILATYCSDCGNS